MSWLDKILPPKIKREDKNASVVSQITADITCKKTIIDE